LAELVKDFNDAGTGEDDSRGAVRNLHDCVQRQLHRIVFRLKAQLHPCHSVKRLVDDTINPMRTDALKHDESIRLIEGNLGGLWIGGPSKQGFDPVQVAFPVSPATYYSGFLY
jgi:hypothetical protein